MPNIVWPRLTNVNAAYWSADKNCKCVDKREFRIMGLFGKKASVPQYDYALIIDFVNGGQGHVYMMRTEAQVKMQ